MVQNINVRDKIYEDLTALKKGRDSYSDAIEDLLAARIENEKLKAEIKELKKSKEIKK